MKYSTPLSLLLWFCIPVMGPSQTVTKQFEQTRYDIKDLHMPDTLHGWAAGLAHWDTAQHKRTSTILKTSDGALSWTAQTVPSQADLWDIHFTDLLHGWAVGDSGTILHTKDGGENWAPQVVSNLHPFKSVFFTDSSSGWAVANEAIHFNYSNEPDAWQGGIWHTADGGQTWTEQEFPAKAGFIHRLYFQDHLRGWAVGIKNDSINVFVDTYGVAYFTDDGGQTWVEKFNSQLELVFTDIDFVDDKKGWLVGFASSSSENGGNIFRTTDGGDSWTRIAEAANETLWQVDFIDSLKGYACGSKYAAAWGPPVLRTNDGGESWEMIRMEEHNDNGLYGMVVFDGSVMAMGDKGYLVQSLDPWGDIGDFSGVDLFTQRLIDTLYEFEDIFFIDLSRGWVAGRKSIGPQTWAQTIMHSDDGGWIWKEQYSFISESMWTNTLRLNAIQFVSPTTGWACGHVVDVGPALTSGMLHTVDGGNTWEQQATGIGFGQLVDLFMFDAQHGWALTDAQNRPPESTEGYVQALKTTDSGATWELINTNQAGLITIGTAIRTGSLFFQDTNKGWILGAQCNLYKTEDGGDTWATVPLPLDWTNTYDIVFSSDKKGTTCGESVFHTEDGGDQWAEFPSINSQFTDMHFTDSIHGWMVGEWGNIYRSKDGGSTWEPFDHDATSAALKSVIFSDPQNGWAAGRGGTIIKIENTGSTMIPDEPASREGKLLSQNYPNPFSDYTVINYQLTVADRVTLTIYDLTGRKISRLVDDFKPSGTYSITWDGRDQSGDQVPPGMYVYQIRTGFMTESRTMIRTIIHL
jgi:photosystem II stability/assembly factor-like uncharacterized protein